METIENKDLYESYRNIINNSDLEDLFEVEWLGKDTFLKTLELFSKNGYSLSYLIEVNMCANSYCHTERIIEFITRQIETLGLPNAYLEHLYGISEISEIDIYSVMDGAGVYKNECRRQNIYLIDYDCVSDNPMDGISQESYNKFKSSIPTYTINILPKKGVVEAILDNLYDHLDLEFTNFEKAMIIAGCNDQFEKIPSVINKILSLKNNNILLKDFDDFIEILEVRDKLK